MAEARLGNFVPDGPGIREIFKGPGMRAALSEVVEDRAGAAESLAHLHRTDKRPEYEGVVKVLDRTAVGVVRPANVLGLIDERYHHTLESLNH